MMEVNQFIDIYDKNFTIGQLQNAFQGGRIVFPERPKQIFERRKRITETIEKILLGVHLPIFFASEQQDGKYVILDGSDCLDILLRFVSGAVSVGDISFDSPYASLSHKTIDHMDPFYQFKILNYQVSLQVIDYRTPRYLHMQIAGYQSNWNYSREQGVRKILYRGVGIDRINKTEQELEKYRFLSTSALNRQYTLLRILMYFFVGENRLQKRKVISGIQELLEVTIEYVEDLGEDDWNHIKAKLVKSLDQIELCSRYETAVYKKGLRMDGLGHSEKVGREQSIRRLGYVHT